MKFDGGEEAKARTWMWRLDLVEKRAWARAALGGVTGGLAEVLAISTVDKEHRWWTGRCMQPTWRALKYRRRMQKVRKVD